MDFFDDDPFFGDMHRMMRAQSRAMDSLMSDMLFDPFRMGPGRQQMGNNARQQMIQDGPSNSRMGMGYGPGSMMPFGSLIGGGNMFGGMQGMMQQMESMQQQALSDPRSQVYSHSTVISMNRDRDGQPRVVERTNSVHKAGRVKEVRKTVRDSETGEDKMTIGHHIGDRGHVITKKRDRDGRFHQDHRYIGIEEDDARRFDDEFGTRVRTEDAPGPSFPIVHTILDRANRRRTAEPAIEHTGPIIEEIDDDEEPTPSPAQQNNNKRYKPAFGGIFSKK